MSLQTVLEGHPLPSSGLPPVLPPPISSSVTIAVVMSSPSAFWPSVTTFSLNRVSTPSAPSLIMVMVAVLMSPVSGCSVSYSFLRRAMCRARSIGDVDRDLHHQVDVAEVG